MHNILGLVSHNLYRHANAKHNGLYDPSCRTCISHETAYRELTKEGNWLLVNPTGHEIIAMVRRYES